MFDASVTVAALGVRLFRARTNRPVITSFGSLVERPSLILEVEDSDGARGWGEVWCNFPAYAAEHRARFLRDVICPMLVGRSIDEPADAGRLIDRELGVQAIQAGEEGLVSAVAAGVDQALWDLVVRRHGLPLWRALGGGRSVSVYASGADPTDVSTVEDGLDAGHSAFKLRAGFTDKLDLEGVARVRAAIGDGCSLIIDANQAWTPRQALEVAQRLERFDIKWLEEPIRADEPTRLWRELSSRSPIPLSAGENIRSAAGFASLVDDRLVRYVQPDLGKWGGVSLCLGVGRRAVSSGLGYSPHWLGGGIGLALSLHLLGAVGGDGLAEMDINPNPLRDTFPFPPVVDGQIELSDDPGFGFEPDFAPLEKYSAPF
jgi:D-galactarolactone cycloisomerase